jgi:poly(A) polymerase Pap1
MAAVFASIPENYGWPLALDLLIQIEHDPHAVIWNDPHVHAEHHPHRLPLTSILLEYI